MKLYQGGPEIKSVGEVGGRGRSRGRGQKRYEVKSCENYYEDHLVISDGEQDDFNKGLMNSLQKVAAYQNGQSGGRHG